jgi:hypothetical protein
MWGHVVTATLGAGGVSSSFPAGFNGVDPDLMDKMISDLRHKRGDLSGSIALVAFARLAHRSALRGIVQAAEEALSSTPRQVTREEATLGGKGPRGAPLSW